MKSIEEMIVGKTYALKGNGNYTWLTIHNAEFANGFSLLFYDEGKDPNYIVKTAQFQSDKSPKYSDFKIENIREATEEETRWLNKAIAAGKYVEKDAEMQYEIY